MAYVSLAESTASGGLIFIARELWVKLPRIFRR
jgi:hypothetical protein